MKNEKEICFITCVNDEAWYEESLLYLRHLALPSGMTAAYLPVRGGAPLLKTFAASRRLFRRVPCRSRRGLDGGGL